MPLLAVDPDLCTRCGTCSTVCPVKIVSPPRGDALPLVPADLVKICLECGHCETYCPTEALLLNRRRDEKVPRPPRTPLSPEILGTYLRQRRSVRHFKSEPVSGEVFHQLFDVVRYAPSSGNSQPVQWLVIRDPREVRRLGGLTVDWLRSLQGTDHPLAPYVQGAIGAWDGGLDLICNGAPHLIVAHVPQSDAPFSIDAIIGLAHVDVLAPAFGLGTCWAGFVSMAAQAWEPMQQALELPEGRVFAYALLCGRPRFVSTGIPRRQPLDITFR